MIARGQRWRAKRRRNVYDAHDEIRIVHVNDVTKRNGNSYALCDNELGGRCSRIRFDILQRDYQRIGS